MDAYAPRIERMMKRLFDSLAEDDRRRYAAIEATKLGHGGVEYIASVLRVRSQDHPPGTGGTGRDGRSGHESCPKKGGGRKKLIEISADTRRELLEGARGPHRWRSDAGRGEVDELVAGADRAAARPSWGLRSVDTSFPSCSARHGYRKRKALKKKTMGPRNPNRNAQFENIARLKKQYLKAGLPVISMDTKKKELLGNFYRDGKIDTQETIETNDHDFGSAGAGTVIPHGLYDVGKNKAFVHLNTSHDTSELACDSIAAWWEQQGRTDYPQAKKLLVLCDGGGSNSATMYLFKEDLQKLANRLGIEIRVAHYPPYCSKYNPIEHRLFPHLTRACRGVIFHTLETVRYYMAKAETTTGLKVKVSILRQDLRDRPEVCRGIQEDHEDRLRQSSPQVELSRVPQPV